MIGSNDKELIRNLTSVVVEYLERGMLDELQCDIVEVVTKEHQYYQERAQVFANARKRFEKV